jgi:hypothetical protein
LIGRSQQIEYPFPIQLEKEDKIENMEEINQQINAINMEAEKTKDYLLASKRLLELDQTNQAVRKFLLEYLTRAEEWDTIINVFAEPKTPSEAISLVESCIKTKNVSVYNNFRESEYARETQDVNVRMSMADADLILRR